MKERYERRLFRLFEEAGYSPTRILTIHILHNHIIGIDQQDFTKSKFLRFGDRQHGSTAQFLNCQLILRFFMLSRKQQYKQYDQRGDNERRNDLRRFGVHHSGLMHEPYPRFPSESSAFP